MKCKRQKWDGETWAQYHKKADEYRRKFWKQSCPYSIRCKTCARAYHMMELSKFRTWREKYVPQEYRKNTSFCEWKYK